MREKKNREGETRVGEDVRKRDIFPSGKVRWCGCCGKQNHHVIKQFSSLANTQFQETPDAQACDCPQMLTAALFGIGEG